MIPNDKPSQIVFPGCLFVATYRWALIHLTPEAVHVRYVPSKVLWPRKTLPATVDPAVGSVLLSFVTVSRIRAISSSVLHKMSLRRSVLSKVFITNYVTSAWRWSARGWRPDKCQTRRTCRWRSLSVLSYIHYHFRLGLDGSTTSFLVVIIRRCLVLSLILLCLV